FYNLSGKPFRLNPDPRMFFNSHSHKRAMSYLLYGVKQGEGFIVITGDVGTGKTMLVGALSSMLERQNVAIANVVTTQIEAEDLLRVAAAEFGLDYRSKSKAIILKNLESYFKECAHLGKRALLLVDEAQNLPPRAVEELRMLSNFQLNGRSLVQSFLLGQKEFRNVMRSQDFVQLRQRVIAAYHLRPLDTAETRAYIEHRLGVVGWKNDPQFVDEVFPLIHRITQGVPRRINLFSDRLLLFASLENKRIIDAAVVTAVTNDLDQEDLLISDEAPEAKDGQSAQVAVLHRGTGANGAKRLDAIEDSLESLGSIVRRELVMLRKAIVDTKFGDTKKPPGDGTTTTVGMTRQKT
ncbi:MAG: XrtA/PEP-CTERM system-associated ATPase, partial [Gammaproteobacteria bacterium]